MNKITVTTLMLVVVLIFSACEKESSIRENELPPTNSGSVETSSETPSKGSFTVDRLVEDTKESKGEYFHFPKLNEELLGERAKKYNREVQELYEEWLTYRADIENEEIPNEIHYSSYIDEERQFFSVVLQYVETRGYHAYKTAVFDLNNPSREITFTEILKSFDWQPEELRKRVKSYFENLYVLDNSHGDSELEQPFQDYDTYITERMTKYDDEVSEGLPFSIEEDGLTVYFTTAFPSFMETYTEKYHVRKNVIDDLFANETFGSIMAIVNMSTESEQAKLNIVDKIQPEGREDGMFEKIFVALEDNVDFYVRTLNYDEKSDRSKPNDPIYRRTLKKGEAVSVLAFISEGIPRLQAVGEYRPKDLETDGSYTFFYDFTYNGLYGEVKIEFLQGEFGNG